MFLTRHCEGCYVSDSFRPRNLICFRSYSPMIDHVGEALVPIYWTALERDICLLDKIVFSDEATFQLPGKASQHNLTINGPQNLHPLVENVSDSTSVNIFCAVSGTRVFTETTLRVTSTSICWSTSWFHCWILAMWFGNKLGSSLIIRGM
jgi:hypothetical protein